MTKREWKTLRVVVEIPVQGDLTEKQLAHETEEALVFGGLYERLQYHRPHGYDAEGQFIEGPHRARTGVLHVKQFSRVKAALTRTIFGRL